MSIFEKLHQQGQQQKQISPDEMRTEIGRIQADPGAYLQQRGFFASERTGRTEPASAGHEDAGKIRIQAPAAEGECK